MQRFFRAGTGTVPALFFLGKQNEENFSGFLEKMKKIKGK